VNQTKDFTEKNSPFSGIICYVFIDSDKKNKLLLTFDVNGRLR